MCIGEITSELAYVSEYERMRVDYERMRVIFLVRF